MKRKVHVVDYGIINLKNIVRGLEKVDAEVKVCSHPTQLQCASNIVVPGVGAFQTGMKQLRERGFDEGLTHAVERGLPTLGICLGMQLFMQESFEHGQQSGLGFITGSVEQIPSEATDGQKRKVPHIGWTQLIVPDGRNSWLGTCLEPLDNLKDSYCYFVHSYTVKAREEEHILAKSVYQGLPIVAAVQSENVMGVQFHPERSGPVGLSILNAFVNLT